MKRASVLAIVLILSGCGSRAEPGPAPSTTPKGALPELVEQAAPTLGADAEEDAEVTRRVRRAFDGDPLLSPIADKITIVTIDSRVMLRGSVPDAEQRQRLAAAARAVDGVVEVDAKLE